MATEGDDFATAYQRLQNTPDELLPDTSPVAPPLAAANLTELRQIARDVHDLRTVAIFFFLLQVFAIAAVVAVLVFVR